MYIHIGFALCVSCNRCCCLSKTKETYSNFFFQVFTEKLMKSGLCTWNYVKIHYTRIGNWYNLLNFCMSIQMIKLCTAHYFIGASSGSRYLGVPTNIQLNMDKDLVASEDVSARPLYSLYRPVSHNAAEYQNCLSRRFLEHWWIVP